jgi:hypothetical protein
MVFTNTITVYTGNNMKRVCMNTLCEKMQKICNVKACMIRASQITLLEELGSITDPESLKRTSYKISRYLIQHSCYFLSYSIALICF